MKSTTRLCLLVSLLVAMPCLAAPTAGIQWQNGFGGSGDDYLWSVAQTSDGGFILGGYSSSGISPTKTSTNYGGADYWLIKTDATGAKVWENAFGGSGNDRLLSVEQTSDGGYILGGESASPPSGNKTAPLYGGMDFWIIKLNAAGDKLWEKSFGGGGYAWFASVHQTTDGGYILGGTSGAGDYWVIKTDGDGNKQWEKSFGSSSYNDQLYDLAQTADGGYLLGGVALRRGTQRYWVVKLDANGGLMWDNDYGSGTGALRSLQQTSDGGYILGGVCNFYGGGDYWVVRLNANGTALWDRYFGGTEEETLYSLQQTSDGGFILGGWSISAVSGNKTTANYNYAGSGDCWIVKLDPNGNKVWERSIGGYHQDYLFSIRQTADRGYILAASSSSDVSGHKTTTFFGLTDFWLVKMGSGPPTILAQPQSRACRIGDSVTFSVSADGSPPLRFQWLFQGAAINGATASTLNLTNATYQQAGLYSAVVSNDFGSVTSVLARLTFDILKLNLYAGLTVEGEVGQAFRVEYVPVFNTSTNWQALTNLTLTNGACVFIDLESPRVPQRFYRAVPVP